ncbi:TRAP-type mannitol/chloroaromatic compound transport system substrate-binding protein [Rhodoferax ferrireducens]|uniref:TRAP-type mannitol/chloroaromatic compound transport system substrate-binding protein n=1 Tax=Rhodoferax ferrireducens TaxID=192843 RepID=A0ABU2CC25_9BURK|nr:hypothetical protein [Rhodoferax ferrireducens]MDR7378851.1 TRAP-type mannitol/chloroaromatic compound transport system substrate-binding protein [Rhodoferax ferrireducens]
MPFAWHGEINKIVDMQAVKERIAGLGGEAASMALAGFGKLIKGRRILGD